MNEVNYCKILLHLYTINCIFMNSYNYNYVYNNAHARPCCVNWRTYRSVLHLAAEQLMFRAAFEYSLKRHPKCFISVTRLCKP